MTVRSQQDNWLSWIPQSVHNKCRDQATVRELAKANSRLYQAKQLTDREYWEVSHLLWLHQAEADGYTPRQLLQGVYRLVARTAQPVDNNDGQVYIFQWILPFADLLLPSSPQGDERQQLMAFWNNWFTLATSSKAGAAFQSPPPSKRAKRTLSNISPDILVTVTFLTALLVHVSTPADGEPTMTNAMTWELLEQKVMNYHYVFRESYVSHLQAAWTLVGVQYIVDHPATFFTRLPGLDPCVLVQSWMQYTGAGILAEFKKLLGLPFYSIKALLSQLLLESVLVEEGMSDSAKQDTIDNLTDFLNGESADTYIDETLAKQEGSSVIQTASSGNKRSRSDSTTTAIDSPLPDEFTSPYFPLKIHIDLWMRKSQWIRAVPCARKLESKSYIDFEVQQDAWLIIWTHLFCQNIFLLDDNHRDSYIYNRRRDILYDEVVAKMGPVGRDLTTDYYESIASLVWNHPTATLEERSYVLIACQQTLLRLMLKWKGLGSETTDYFLKETKWPVQLTSSAKDSYDWAIRFLMQKVSIPLSLIKLQGIDKTPVPDLNRFYNGNTSEGQDEEEFPATTPASLAATEEPASVEEVPEDGPEEAYEVVEEEETAEEMVDTPTLPSEMINAMDDEEEPESYGYPDNEDDAPDAEVDAEVVEDVDEVDEVDDVDVDVDDGDAEDVDVEAVDEIDDDAEEYYQDNAADIAPSPSVIEMLDDSDDGSDTRDETEPMSGGDVDRYSSDDDDASREDNADQESGSRAALEENPTEDDRVTDTHSEAVSEGESEAHSDQEGSRDDGAYPTPPPTNYHASSDDMLEADEQTEEDQGTELSELEDPEGSKDIPPFSGASEMEGSALLDFAQSAQSRYEGVQHNVDNEDTIVPIVPETKRQVDVEHANDADVDTEEIDDEGDTEDQDAPSQPTNDMAEESHEVHMAEDTDAATTVQGDTDQPPVEGKTTCEILRDTVAEIGAENDEPQKGHGDDTVEEPTVQIDDGAQAVADTEDIQEAIETDDVAAAPGYNAGSSVLSGEFADVDEARSQTSMVYDVMEEEGATNVAISGISEIISPADPMPESTGKGDVSHPGDASLLEHSVEQDKDEQPVLDADEERLYTVQPPEPPEVQIERKAPAAEEQPEEGVKDIDTEPSSQEAPDGTSAEEIEQAVDRETEEPAEAEQPVEKDTEEPQHTAEDADTEQPVEEESEEPQHIAEDADTEQPVIELPDDSKPSDETDLTASAIPQEESPSVSEAPIVPEGTNDMETAGSIVEPQSPVVMASETPQVSTKSHAAEANPPPTTTDVSAEVPDKPELSHVTEVQMSETPVAEDREDATMIDLDPNAPSPDDPLPPSPPTVPIASEMSVEGLQSVPADDTMDEDHVDQVVPMDSSEPVFAMEESPQRTDYSMDTDFVAEDMEADEADTRTIESQQMVTDGVEKEVPMEAEVPPPVPITVVPVVNDTEMELKPAPQEMEPADEVEKPLDVPGIEQDEPVDEKNDAPEPKEEPPSVLETTEKVEVLETPRRSRRSRRTQGIDMANPSTLVTVPESEPAPETGKWTELEVAQTTATSPLFAKTIPVEGVTNDETPLRKGSRTNELGHNAYGETSDVEAVSDEIVDKAISGEGSQNQAKDLVDPSEKEDVEIEEEERSARKARKLTKSTRAATRKSRSTRITNADDDNASVDASIDPSMETTDEVAPKTRRSARKSRSAQASKSEDDDKSIEPSSEAKEATPRTRRAAKKPRRYEDDIESVGAPIDPSMEATDETALKTRSTARKSRSTKSAKVEAVDASIDPTAEATDEAAPKTKRTARKSRANQASKAGDDNVAVDASIEPSIEAKDEATPATRKTTRKPRRNDDDSASVDSSIAPSVDTTDETAPKTGRTARKSRSTRSGSVDADNVPVEASINAEAEVISKAKKGTPARKSKKTRSTEVEDTDDESTVSTTQSKRRHSKRGTPVEEESDVPSTPRTGARSKRRKATDAEWHQSETATDEETIGSKVAGRTRSHDDDVSVETATSKRSTRSTRSAATATDVEEKPRTRTRGAGKPPRAPAATRSSTRTTRSKKK